MLRNLFSEPTDRGIAPSDFAQLTSGVFRGFSEPSATALAPGTPSGTPQLEQEVDSCGLDKHGANSQGGAGMDYERKNSQLVVAPFIAKTLVKKALEAFGLAVCTRILRRAERPCRKGLIIFQ